MMMGTRKLHAVIYRGTDGAWVAYCVEYDIASQGTSRAHALEMLREAVELHLEDISKDELDLIDNEVGSEPQLETFSVRAAALLDG